jgi:hypothetical protein
MGIGLFGIGSAARENHIRNLSGGIAHVGINMYHAYAVISGNVVVNEVNQAGRGIWGVLGTFCSGNMVAGYTTEGITSCDLVAGNAVH